MTGESRQQYKKMQCRTKTELAKVKQKTYGELHKRLDTKEGERNLHQLKK